MAYQTPETLKYTKEHEWASFENNIITIGITDYAQSQLGDIVFVELPEIGQELAENSSFGVVESIKSVSDLYCPVSGTVIEINEELESGPELLNEAPYQNWLIRLKVENDTEYNLLLDSGSYSELCTE